MKRKAIKVCCAIITAYQTILSPIIGNNCRYQPSCSQYAKEVIRLHGPAKGILLAIWRIMRCHPFSKGGLDLPPEKFTVIQHKPKELVKKGPLVRNLSAPSNELGTN